MPQASFPPSRSGGDPFGSPAANVLPTFRPAPTVQPADEIEAWCHKHGLGNEECDALKKLGFKLGDKLDNLPDEVWTWAEVPPLRRIRIVAAYNTSLLPEV